VYGLTGEEGNVVCQTIKTQFEARYEGKVDCIISRGS
jgi:hypothetical protein